jgi:hypothetical protein
MKELDKKLKRKISALVVLGILVLVSFVPLALGAPNWTETDNDINDDGSYYIDIDADDDDEGEYHDEVFAVTKHGGSSVGTELFRVQENGNVGIGTSTPRKKLDILDSSGYAQLRLTYTDFSVYTDLTTTSDGYLAIGPTGWNVGIGTAHPDHQLHILSNGYTDSTLKIDTYYAGYDSGIRLAEADTDKWFITNEGDTDKLHIASDGGIAFETRLTIQQDGNIGIGTASPINRLSVSGDADFTGKVGIGTSNPTLGKLQIDNAPAVGCSLYIANPVGVWWDNGDINIGGNLFIGADQTQAEIQAAVGRPLYINNDNDADVIINNGGGDVGIGTTVPSGKLEVVGNIVVSGTVDGVDIDVEMAALEAAIDIEEAARIAGDNALQAEIDALEIEDALDYDSLADLETAMANGVNLATTSGNVGIGTVTPGAKLEVAGSGHSIKLTDSGNNYDDRVVISHSAEIGGYLDLYTFQESLGTHISSFGDSYFDSGNVGFGTPSPNEQLTLDGVLSLDERIMEPSATGGYGKLYVTKSNSHLYFMDDSGSKYDITAAVSSGIFGSGSSNYIPKFTSSNTIGNSAIYESGGQVGIGTNTPSEELEVVGTVKATYFVGDGSGLTNVPDLWTKSDTDIYYNDGNVGIGTSTLGSNDRLTVKSAGSDSSYYGLKVQNSGGTDQFVVRSDGKVGIGTTNPAACLDVETDMISIPGYNARGIQYDGSLTAGSNNDILTGASISPNFQKAGYSDIMSIGLQATSGNGDYKNIGLYGLAHTSGEKYGVWGRAQGTGTNYGIYGDASGGTTNWAGYFEWGDVYIQDNLGIGTTNLQGKLTVGDFSTVNNVVFNSPNSLQSGSTIQFRESNDWLGFQIRHDTEDNHLHFESYVSGSKEDIIMTFQRDTGRVGIGRTDPKKMLHVAGDFKADGNLIGDIIKGAIGKIFEIDHPLDPENKSLVHACPETPEWMVSYRGTGTLVDGELEVELPDYFDALTTDNTYTVLLTAKGDTPFDLSYDSFDEESFIVYGTNDTGEFDWEVSATRDDVDPLEVEPDKEPA